METSKAMTNLKIADLLRDIAAAYQLKDVNKYKFQIIAYQRAADSVEHATSELRDLWEEKKLDEIAGIGSSIQEHLDELFKTGKSKHFEELTKDILKIFIRLSSANQAVSYLINKSVVSRILLCISTKTNGKEK